MKQELQGISRPEIKDKEISTTATAKQNTPDFEVKNLRNKDIKIFYITILPDPTFKTNGILLAEIEGQPTILEIEAGSLVRTSELVLGMTPNGAIFPRNTTLKFFAWVTSGTGKVTVFVTIGE